MTLHSRLLHRLLYLCLVFCFLPFISEGQQLLGGCNLSRDELRLFHEEERNFKKQRNTFLNYVTRAQELSLLGKLHESNDYFEKAYWLLDSSKHHLPHTDHYGFAYEGFMLLYLKAVNFFELQKPELALVECNRMRDWLNAVDLNLAEDFNNELFPHQLLGLLYEAEEMPNDAFIEYQISYRLYQQDEGEFFGVTNRQTIQAAILRTALAAGLNEQFTELQEEFNLANFKKTEEHTGGTLTVICHLGVGPHKNNDDEPADYQINANNQFSGLKNSTNGVIYKFESAFAINPWKHNNWWTSLPRGIYYVTVPLQMGKNEFAFMLKDSLDNPHEHRFEILGTSKHQLQVVNSITHFASEYVNSQEAEKYLHADSIQGDKDVKENVGHKTRRWPSWPVIFFPDHKSASSITDYSWKSHYQSQTYWKNEGKGR